MVTSALSHEVWLVGGGAAAGDFRREELFGLPGLGMGTIETSFTSHS